MTQSKATPVSRRAISLVIPVFNSAQTLTALHRRISVAMRELDASYECLLIDDCSSDGSWAGIQELAKADPRIRGFRMARNFGQHNAILAGIRLAKGGVIVTLDDDLQNPPEEIGKLLQALNDDCEVVYGSPEREQHGALRDAASRIAKYALAIAMGNEVARRVSAFRAFKTHLRDAFAQYQAPTVNIDVLLTWGTTRFGAVTVRHDERESGRSGYSWWRLLGHAFNLITGFTTLPLQIGSALGLVCAAIGFGLLLFVLVRYVLQGAAVPGFTFLSGLIAIFFGSNMLLLGIFGEYLARIHIGSVGRPSYLIEGSVEGDSRIGEQQENSRVTGLHS
jgi:undecaprenyl-phosphate 4-deoxy-4-formamido-L-arabinose transferase